MNSKPLTQLALSAAHETLMAIGLFVAVVALPACRDKGSGQPSPEQAKGAASQGKGAAPEHADDGHGGLVKLTADAITRYGIKVETASLHKLQPTFTAPARVAFDAEAIAHVGTPLPGRVIDLKVRLGDNVKKGDALLVVESPELGEAQSEFLVKQIAAKTAVSAVELAQSALDRAKGLYEENRAIALDEVKRREGEHKSAQAALMSAQAAATAAENKLHLLGMDQTSVDKLRESSEVNPRFTIVAPIAGQVVEREVTLGELVSREKEALLVLADIDNLWVLADVPETRLAEIAVGTKTRIHAGTLDPHQHEGLISYIAPQVDPRTRTSPVRIVVKCEDGSLKPGIFVQVELTSTNRGDPDPAPVVAVPEEAVQTIEGQALVFVPVPNEANVFTQRIVKIGKPVGGVVPVVSGLAAGEQFVATGSFIMKAELTKSAGGEE